jgi:aminomethyltransferase
MTITELLRTPLHSEHLRLKALMAPFGGWDMPIRYEGILAEHGQARRAAALFDISHMGEFLIRGGGEDSGLERIFTARLYDMPAGTSRYGVMCNAQGGVVDDCIIFRIDQETWFMVVNGATIAKDAAHVREHLASPDFLTDVSEQTGKLDLQGPLARDVLRDLIPGVSRLGYFEFDEFVLLGEKALVSRTGYTGELGYEIFYPGNKTAALWKALLDDARVKPAGLGARDLLRLEMGYSLYGHELSDELTPLESGLGRFVDFEKDFIGKEALLSRKEKGLPRKIIGLVSDSRRAPREGHKIFDGRRQEAGRVTSGGFSPVLNAGIGLALVRSDVAVPGTAIYFGDGDKTYPGRIHSRLFYRGGSAKD